MESFGFIILVLSVLASFYHLRFLWTTQKTLRYLEMCLRRLAAYHCLGEEVRALSWQNLVFCERPLYVRGYSAEHFFR